MNSGSQPTFNKSQKKTDTGKNTHFNADWKAELDAVTPRYLVPLPFIILTVLFILTGVLLFDAKLFLMSDDADYIIEAYKFVHEGVYPTGRSSLYTVVLALPVAIFGTQIVILKCFSFLCALVGFLILAYSLKNKVSGWALYPVLVLSVINCSIQYYSSSNLSEAFFMMIQYAYIAIVFALINKLKTNTSGNINRYWLVVGLMSLLISISKNIAIVAPVGLCVYFLLKKEWKNSFWAMLSFLIFKIPYEIFLRLAFTRNTLISQWDQVMAKNLYHHEHGMETFSGFIDRFLANSKIYLSQITLNEFGFNISNSSLTAITICFVLLLLYGLIHAYKKNNYIFFIGIYTAAICAGTFFALQPAIYQGRIIIIVVPLLFLLSLYSILALLEKLNKNMPHFSIISVSIILFFLLITNIKRTSDKISETFPVFAENIRTQPFYGYTNDWISYLEMGSWIKQNIPDSIPIAARKPNSLTVYSGGRPFVGIYSFPTNLNANQLLEKLKKENIKYLVVASIRANAEFSAPNNIITTIHNYIAKIESAYPGTFRLVHKTGKEEPCLLAEIKYPKVLKPM
jgi:hypothetical protein